MAKKRMNDQSRMTEVLKGQTVNGKTVDNVRKSGDRRIVDYTDGTRDVMPKGELLKDFNRVAGEQQASRMRRSRRYNEDGSVNQTVGGAREGKRQTYTNKQAAEAALQRRYGKKN